MKHHFIQKIFTDRKGSIIIALIVTIVTLSALGAAMVSLTSTSMSSLVGANSSSRAYYLAESGFRYAESRYLNPGAKTRDEVLAEDVHDQQRSLLANDGRFITRVYPYYFKVSSNPEGTSTLNAKVPGGFPAGLTLSSGRLKIGAKASNIYNYNAATPTGPDIVFNMTQTLPYFPSGTDVLSVAVSSSSNQTVLINGSLQLQAGTAGAFPLRNGTFEVNGHVYAYREKDLINNRLTDITDPDDPGMVSFDVAANSDIVLQKFIKFESTGEFGLGSEEASATRTIEYQIPLAAALEVRKEFIDTFDDKLNWEATSTYGSHDVQIIGGDRALKVTGTSAVAGAPRASLIKFDWIKAGLDFSAVHASGNDYFLSYDAQVKVGFDSSPYPTYGFFPAPPIPVYYVAGLSFRLDNDNNSYGLSFLRGSNSTAPTPDNIDNAIVALDQRTLIILWQQTNFGATRNWLAYKDITATGNFFDDVENGNLGWTPQDTCGTDNGLWHISSRRSYTSTHSWYYGRETQGNYDIGRNCGALVMPPVNLCSASTATLTFWSWYETESEVDPLSVDNYDLKYVEISIDGGDTWSPYQLKYAPVSGDPFPAVPMRTWVQLSLDLTPYIGHTVQIRFRFDTRDAAANNFEGWYIDDVSISSDAVFPLNEATLMIRVQEVASITFINAGLFAIETGDTVVGQASGARGKVAGAPILSAGSWVAGNAAGTLMLKNVIGTFTAGETVSVAGSSTVLQATGFRGRDNFIRAYFGDTSGCGTPSNRYLDDEKHANARGSVRWAPEELVDWAAVTDYFTLVQWDAINSGVNLMASTDEPKAIIRSDSITSPTSGPFLQPELGLHTFGMGSENIYFDDFAVQTNLSVNSNTGFTRAIQQ